MTTRTAEYLTRLQSRGITLQAEGERLRVQAPPGALSAELRRELADRKGELLELLRDGEGPAAASPTPERPGDGPDTHPPSFGQEQLWYLGQLNPGAPTYHMPAAFRIRGSVDEEALERSLNQVRRRHDALRTTLRIEGGELVQRVQPFRPVTLSRREIDAAPGSARDAELERILREEIEAPFEISNEPPFRWVLVRLSEDERAFLHVAHHAFFDGWSLRLFIDELFTTYRALLRGEVPDLGEVPFQYGAFARWQREWLQGHRLEGLLDHWRGRLENPPGLLTLPADRERPPVRSNRGAVERVPLSEGTAERLRLLAREAQATPFMVLMSAVQLLLHRYSGSTDVVVGTPVAGRKKEEFQRTIGLFINAVPIRGDLSGNPSFRELVARLRLRILDAFEHQALPFGKLVEALAPERSASHDPLVHVLFRYWKREEGGEAPPGLEVEPITVHSGGALADLDLSVVEREDGSLELALSYTSDLFDRSTAARMLGHYQTLLGEALRQPERPVGELPLLTEGERRRILGEWTDTEAELGPPATLHGLVREAAERFPEGPALEWGDREALSRPELLERARRLAHRLREEGVERGTRVGVLLPRTGEMVVSLLAVLEAGGVYVPLDPDFPSSRLAFMLDDADALLVLTTSTLAPLLPEEDGSPRRILLDEEADELARRPTAPLPGEKGAGPDDPAYAIYTSGSTGRPKGVLVAHRSVVNFLRAMARAPGLTPRDRLLAVTTLSFDISVLELFLPLLTGGVTVLTDRETASDGRRLLSLIRDARITVLQATPATWRLLIDAGWEGAPPLRVLCGGEALAPDLARELLERSSEVWNLYGPTEATVWCARQRLRDPDRPVLIGKPIENTRAYVLDPAGNPVPAGITGELWIGGAQVALGYLGRPDLTEERFRPDPFSKAHGGRMYRTGDLARWLPDGTLQCLGRTDHQVKVRGFRIELGEIEAALGRLDEVGRAVVGVHDDPAAGRRLVAWVRYRPGRELLASEVRLLLRDLLPDHMVPSLVVEVKEIPLTPNGKVDRKALPDPIHSGAASEDTFVEPSTPTERLLADVWKEALKVPRVGARDNFFDLGGHSLLAMRTLLAMEERTGFRFDPRDMILGTVEQLAARAEAERNNGDGRARS